MMRSHIFSIVLVSVLSAAATSAYAQQPPDIVQSDISYNTAVGDQADIHGGGESNVAVGEDALARSGGVGFNTAVGAFSIWLNGIGDGNSALGYEALGNNDSGFQNTASGLQSLVSNLSGYWNTASGVNSLGGNNTGHSNTGAGINVLCANTTGNENTGMGAFALSSGSYTPPRNFNVCTGATGDDNSALGAYALFANVSGSNNTASGAGSMRSNTTGAENTALGYNALGTNQGGSNNIAVGANAGYYLRGSRYNIDIGNVGESADVGLIRLGTSGQQTATYIAGIGSAHVTGGAVYVSATGQLGVLASSERYKTAIAPMASSSDKLHQLRPVTFKLKTDPQGARQYGLIAEEVAKVYPELVIRNGSGQIEGVRYEELAPMLLNEVQQQAVQLQELQQRLAVLEAKDGRVAQR